MSDNRKEQERAELHRTIWNIANDLRGSVDGRDFKQYVLGILFYRYISENITAFINTGEREAGDETFDYAKMSDAQAEQASADLVATKGFFILPGELFENVRSHAAADENLNETLEIVFKNIETSAQGTVSEDDFKGLFDDIDVNSNKLGGTVARRNERLVKLLNGVGDMKLTNSNKLTEANIRAVPDAYATRADVDYFARLVPNSEIAGQDYNLSVSGYVVQEDKRATVDIAALNSEIALIVEREDVLRREIDAIIAEIEGGSGL